MQTRPPGLLNIPVQSKPTTRSFHTKPKQVVVWLNQLPMADTGECARQIYSTLRELNQLKTAYRARLNILSAISGQVFEILKTLNKHYANQSLPLSEKNKKIAELAIALNTEMATGYKIVVEKMWSKEPSVFKKSQLIYVIHHAIHYLSNVLLVAYQTYVDPPEKVWLQIHQLYLYTAENGLDSRLVKETDNGTTPACNIRKLYKKILLLGLISPYRLRQATIERVYNMLTQWSNYCHLYDSETYSEHQNHVMIRMNSDVAPGFFNNYEAASGLYSRILDTTELIQVLNESILQQQISGKLESDIQLPTEIVKLLSTTWSGLSKRAFSRTSADNMLSLTLGISATFNLITNLQRKYPNIGQVTLCDSIIPVLFGESMALEDISFAEEPILDTPTEFANVGQDIANLNSARTDRWTHNYIGQKAGYDYNLQLWLNQQTKKHLAESGNYSPDNYDNINESAGGYCLIGYLDPDNSRAKVQIGELTGIREHRDSSSNIVGIGVVRRIRTTDQGIELGIQKLTPCAETIATSEYNADYSKLRFMRSIILPALKSVNQPVTILTHDLYKVGDELIINKHGFNTHVNLIKLLETTGVFSQFEFSVLNYIGVDKQTNEKSNTDDRFEKVWSLI